MRRLAADLDVAGWIRNCADGSVEAVFEGSPESVRRLVEYCHAGPPGATVQEVEAQDESPQGEQSFAIR